VPKEKTCLGCMDETLYKEDENARKNVEENEIST
jgi:hypothetical protein